MDHTNLPSNVPVKQIEKDLVADCHTSDLIILRALGVGACGLVS